MSRSRVFASVALAGMLVVAATTAGPAFAEDPPPLEWTTVSGFPVITPDGEVTVAVKTATIPASDIGAVTDFPVQRIEIVNESLRTRYFHFGIDIDIEGLIEPLWKEETLAMGSGTGGALSVILEPGQSIVETDAIVYHGFTDTIPGVPVYPGRTIAIYELDADPRSRNRPGPPRSPACPWRRATSCPCGSVHPRPRKEQCRPARS